MHHPQEITCDPTVRHVAQTTRTAFKKRRSPTRFFSFITIHSVGPWAFIVSLACYYYYSSLERWFNTEDHVAQTHCPISAQFQEDSEFRTFIFHRCSKLHPNVRTIMNHPHAFREQQHLNTEKRRSRTNFHSLSITHIRRSCQFFASKNAEHDRYSPYQGWPCSSRSNHSCS